MLETTPFVVCLVLGLVAGLFVHPDDDAQVDVTHSGRDVPRSRARRLAFAGARRGPPVRA